MPVNNTECDRVEDGLCGGSPPDFGGDRGWPYAAVMARSGEKGSKMAIRGVRKGGHRVREMPMAYERRLADEFIVVKVRIGLTNGVRAIFLLEGISIAVCRFPREKKSSRRPPLRGSHPQH
jgi:hypothetical protein